MIHILPPYLAPSPYKNKLNQLFKKLAPSSWLTVVLMTPIELIRSAANAKYGRILIENYINDPCIDLYTEFDQTCQQYSGDYDIITRNVITFDHAPCPTMEVTPLGLQTDKYVIWLDRRTLICKPAVESAARHASQLQCHFVLFNFRTNASAIKDYVVDLIAQIQYLVDVKQVLPENISVYGACHDGAIATMAARYFHKHGQLVNLITKSTFTSSTDYAYPMVREEIPIPRPLLRFVLKATRLESNPAAALKSVDANHRACLTLGGDEQQTSTQLDLRLPKDIDLFQVAKKKMTAGRQRKFKLQPNAGVIPKSADELHTLSLKMLHNQDGEPAEDVLKQLVHTKVIRIS